jgi:hypothetical protein
MKQARPTAQYSPTPICARGHQPVYAGPRPHVPYACIHTSAPTPQWHGWPPATSAPHAVHAAATSLCVPRLYPLCSCHVGAEFLFVSSLLASALLLPRELAVATLFPTNPSSSEPGNQTPTFPSPCRTLLELAS